MPSSQHAEIRPEPGRLLPIRTVARLTGVNPITLRAWERRYNLITPKRTPKGHRLYTEGDIQLIQQVLDLLDQGVAISQVKPLLGQAAGERAAAPARGPGEVWKHYQQQILEAIEGFDEFTLDKIYNEALSLYPVDIVSQGLITPVLRILGENWQRSETGIAEEHFFSVYLRNKLGTRLHHINQHGNASLLLLACLPGEFHEIGLLLFALAAIDLGYRVLVLGANTPLQQLPGVLEKRRCNGIVLSCSYRPSRGILVNDLPELVNSVGVPVFVGGNAAATRQDKIEAAGAIYLGEVRFGSLKKLGDTLSRQQR